MLSLSAGVKNMSLWPSQLSFLSLWENRVTDRQSLPRNAPVLQGNESYWKCNQKDKTPAQVQSAVELNQAVLSGLSL